LRDFGLYPQKIVPTAEEFPAMENEQPAAWKKGIHWLEWMVFYPFCLLARSLDKDNTLWAWGRKP
jgi:hypothetical protein